MSGGRKVLAGIALALGASACFAALDTTSKLVTASVPLMMALWFRYAFQAVATTLAVARRGRSVWRTHRLPAQVLRGVLLLACSLLALLSLRFLPVGEFTAIVMISPLAITLLAAVLFKESVSPLRWALVAGGFAGTLLIIRPGHAAFTWASLLPLVLVAANVWFQMLTSHLSRTEDPITTHLYTGWVGALLATLALPAVWAHVPDWRLWLGLCLMGVLGTVGHFLLVLAYQRTQASTLTPYLYTQIAFAMLGGVVIFGHVPDAVSLAGMAVIAVCGAAGAWLAVRERR